MGFAGQAVNPFASLFKGKKLPNYMRSVKEGGDSSSS